jgi:DsbC/DsbD-like thiol-disulfide interchange protein
MTRLFTQGSAFNPSWLSIIFLLILALQGCSQRPNSTADGLPQASPTGVSSSADVVKLRSDDVLIPAGGNIDAKVLLSISPGFHVNANPATFAYLIATKVTTGKVEGINAGAPNYPAPVKRKFQFAEQPLAVYEGEVSIKLNLRAEKNAGAGPRSLPITLTVQACDEEKCYPPATLNSTISVTVK